MNDEPSVPINAKTKWRVLAVVSHTGYVDIEAPGERSALRAVRELLTAAPNPLSHLSVTHTPSVSVDRVATPLMPGEGLIP